MVVRLDPASLKTSPKTTRNISGKKNVKNSAMRSRKKLRSMARASVRNDDHGEAWYVVRPAGGAGCGAGSVAVAVLMRGTPVR
ncbi:hypothetical protein GCM10027446_14370 [Angustibacter peucedani]